MDIIDKTVVKSSENISESTIFGTRIQQIFCAFNTYSKKTCRILY